MPSAIDDLRPLAPIDSETGPLRVLDFDVECRPMAWYAGEFVTKQPTAIAWKFIGERGKPTVAVIGESYDARRVLDEEREMLEQFREAFNAADVVTGHYIRGYDLPTLVAAYMRLGLPILGGKLAQDTKIDLVRTSGISLSQENLGGMYELEHPKVGMNTASWMAANMLLPEGIAASKRRVVGDVMQHIELRERLLEAGVLGPPKPWASGERPRYHA